MIQHKAAPFMLHFGFSVHIKQNMLPKIYLPFLLLLFFVTGFAGKVNAQKTTRIEIVNADSFSAEKVKGQEIRRLRYNVVLKHEDVTMYCDSAYIFPDKNTMIAYSNVRINQGDSMQLFGNRLDYDGNRRMAVVKENVVLQDSKMTLVTDRLDYDIKKKMAYYTNGGTITDAENQLTSKIGYYFTSERNLYFRKEVNIMNPDFNMTSDTLQYNIISRRAYFHGPTKIVSEADTIYSETGWYSTVTGEAHFNKDAYVKSGGQVLLGDSLDYNKAKGYSKAIGNVKIIDSVQKLTITGQYAVNYDKLRITYITKDVLVMQEMDEDTIYMTADTMRSGYDSSGKYRILKGYQNVLMFSRQFQSSCDSLTYSFVDSTVDMRVQPVLWFGAYQVTADHIVLFTKKNNIVRAELYQNSFMASREDTLRYSQIKGRNMIGYFVNNKLEHVDVTGNGESIYFIKDDKEAYVGVNKIVSSDVKIFMKDQQVSRISFINEPDAILIPIKQAKPEDMVLEGFRWRGQERPENVPDMMAKRKNAAKIKAERPVIKNEKPKAKPKTKEKKTRKKK